MEAVLQALLNCMWLGCHAKFVSLFVHGGNSIDTEPKGLDWTSSGVMGNYFP